MEWTQNSRQTPAGVVYQGRKHSASNSLLHSCAVWHRGGTVSPMPKLPVSLPGDYAGTLEALKQRITSAQIRAHRAVNTELVTLYWEIGKTIIRQARPMKWWGLRLSSPVTITQ